MNLDLNPDHQVDHDDDDDHELNDATRKSLSKRRKL